MQSLVIPSVSENVEQWKQKMESSVGGKINCYSTLETIFAVVLFYFH